MPTYREQIEAAVDEAVKQGRIAAPARDQMIQMMAADEQAAQYWSGQLLRAGDYTRKTQELSALRAQQEQELAAERARFQAERQQLEQWQRDAQAEVARLRANETRMAEMAAKVGAYEQIIQDYNLGDAVKVPQLGQPVQQQSSYTQDYRPASQAPVQPAAQWISREDASAALSGIMEIQGKALRIMAEHQSLFGAPPTDLDELMQTSIQTGQPIDQLWQTKHNVDGRRAQLAQQKAEQEQAAMREQLRAELMTEFTTDPTRLRPANPFQPAPSQIFDTYGKPRVEGDSRAIPEAKSDMAAARSRVADATEYFMKNFNPDGTPRSTGSGPTGLGV